MNRKEETLRIGTRGSALALSQTQGIADRIGERHPDLRVAIVPIKTTGDKMQDVSLAKIGGKGVFIKEIEEALLRGEVDLAVHSLKDVPSEIPGGLEIGIVPEREDPRDVLVSRDGRQIEELPRGARIGTGSLRRTVQLKHRIPGIEIVPIRGNIGTRIGKIETEGLDGVILAAAGLKRLGWIDRVSQFLPEDLMIPAIGQGALALELRKGDGETREMLLFLQHEPSYRAAEAERAFLKVFGGGCQLPIAAHARLENGGLRLVGAVGSLDGAVLIRDEISGPAGESESIGRELAERILTRGGKEILENIVQI